MPRSGRPRKLDDDDKAKPLNAIDKNPRASYEDLLSTIDYKVKRASIERLLAKEGRLKWLVLDRPDLTPFTRKNDSNGLKSTQALLLVLLTVYFSIPSVELTEV